MRNDSSPSGCALGVIALLFLAGLLAVLGLIALRDLTDAQAGQTRAEAALEYERGRSTALMIQASGQARLDSALAAATISAAALPWGILGILGLLGLAVCGLVALAIALRPQIGPPPRIIERQIIMIPSPGQTRSQIWHSLSDTELFVIPDKRGQ